ncbi:MAG: chromosome segregation protein SMC [Clostridiales bacterium]|nr:chromosome segregation protein SMC [Clostridiales bacterium]
MRLTKLEIYGFKSFAKRTEIVFPQNVTGIVGPNGSGKSNISDAVRWVLGEQSAKTLRGNSMSDVIFNGTEKKKPMNYCEVTLVFDNSDYQLKVEYAEVSITRRVYRSGDSEYLMNGSNCRLKDIVDLFRDTGVGKEGYSIVGQGRIDEILSQRSEDRRAIFEEAAGISRFRMRKEEAEGRLKRADDNLVRVIDVIEELHSHLSPLKKQAEVAKEYLSLSDMLKELDIKLFLLRHQRLEEKQSTAELALLQVTDSVMESEKHLEKIAMEREAGEEKLEELQHTLSEAHDHQLLENDNLHQAREVAAAIDNRIENERERMERLKSEAQSVANRIKLIEATMTQSDGGLSGAEELLAQAAEALEARKISHAQVTEKAQTLEDELSEHKTFIMDRMNSIQNIRTTQARQSAMQQQMTQRRTEIENQLAGEDEREVTLSEALEEAKQNLQNEETTLEGLRGGAEAFDQSTKQLLADILSKQKQVQEDAQSARAVDTRLRTLKELQDGYEGYQYSVKNALTYAKRQKLTGVHDVIAMLLHVPKDYETALDMALGAAMQNIVTQSESDAKDMIDYLRKNRLGRATFLPLSTVRGRTLSQSERSVLSMKGCVGVASELCSFDPIYRPVMESLLGRTIIAESLECGIEIMRAGRHSFRLVTLGGDVMHSGGSMTGGSIQQKAQNLLGREREMKELGASLEEITQRVVDSQALITQMEARRAGVKERREQAQYELHQQEIAVVRDGERLSNAEADYQAHVQRSQGLREAIEQLCESLDEINEELAKIERQSSADDISTDELNLRTEQLAIRLDKARRERESSQEALTDAMLTLTNAEHDCDRIRRDQQRLLGDGESCERELAALEQKQKTCAEDLQDANQGKADAEAQIESSQKRVDAAKEHAKDMEIKRDEKQRDLRELQGEIDGLQLLVSKGTERMHRQEMALTRIKNDLSQLSDRLWNTYELSFAGAQETFAVYAARDEGTMQELAPFDEGKAEQDALEIRERIRRMGTVNVAAIEEYAQMNERYTQLSAQRNDLEQAKKDLLELIGQLLEQMETVFIGQFSLLQDYFAETFVRLFGGGRGEISLSDPNDPLGCGIDIIVQPPGKKRQILSLFSGGERALTAIAILFAMLKLKPTPFCILDEIEAALDDANISYFADYLKEFSENTQFIVVTHRKGTMERCDTLFGVAMEERGVSSMVSVNLTDYE